MAAMNQPTPNRETPANVLMRTCKGCNQAKPLTAEHFAKNVPSRGGFKPRCRSCERAEYYRRQEDVRIDRDKRRKEAERWRLIQGYE